MNARDTIIIEYGGLRDGEVSGSQLCPVCNGGASKERTLSVGRSGERLWAKCHRASCGFAMVHSDRVPNNRPPVAAVQRRALIYKTRPMTDDERALLLGKVHKSLADDALYTDQYGGRYVLPVHDSKGRRVGNVLRSYNGGVPKALGDVLGGYDGCSWHGDTEFVQHVVIVEDVVSAARIGAVPNFVGVALLGTEFTESRVNDIRSVPASKRSICLDADALPAGITATIKLRDKLNAKVYPLTKDVKDMTDEEFAYFITTVGEHK